MPIYEYRCASCGAELEKLQKISDPPLLECPECGKDALVKLVSASSFRLKGSGWYETDFKTGKKKNGAGDSAGEGAASGTGDTGKSDAAGSADSSGSNDSDGSSKSKSKAGAGANTAPASESKKEAAGAAKNNEGSGSGTPKKPAPKT